MELYQRIILERSQSKRYFGKPRRYRRSHYARNPLCGDEVTVYWDLTPDRGGIVRYEAYGCAICLSSADLLAEIMTNRKQNDIRLLTDEVLNAIETGATLSANTKPFGDDLAAILKIRAYPSRIKCATLPWSALSHCLV